VQGVREGLGGPVPPETRAAPNTRRASDLTLIAGLDPTLRVIAFSGDNSSVLVSAGPTMQEVVDLQDGRVVWRGEGTAALSSFAVQPGGNAFAIALVQP